VPLYRKTRQALWQLTYRVFVSHEQKSKEI
jgi:hypothetical protein